jgi:hypothetical protein
LAAFVAADLAFSGTGIGLAINVFAGGLAIIFVGTQAFSGGQHLFRFYRLAAQAKTSDQFRNAGKEFAEAVVQLGVTTVAIWLTRRTGTSSRGKAKGAIAAPDAEASWRALADSIDFNIPKDRGVIYAGLSYTLERRATFEALENPRNVQAQIINKTAKQYGWTQENMMADFGEESATTYRLWEYLSLKYQQALEGHVTAYISKITDDKGMLLTERGAGEMTDGKGPSVILTELEELMTSNKKVTRSAFWWFESYQAASASL